MQPGQPEPDLPPLPTDDELVTWVGSLSAEGFDWLRTGD